MIGDLHCHTTLSDGSLGIEDIIVQAKKTGIDFISITDHDTMSSINRAKVLGERYGVQTIPGVELSAWDKKRNRKVHILCYAPQKPDRLEGLCIKSCEIRRKCAAENGGERYEALPDNRRERYEACYRLKEHLQTAYYARTYRIRLHHSFLRKAQS